MIVKVPIHCIQPNPWQTRIGEPDPDGVRELALDIAANRLMQFPVARLVLPSQVVPGSFIALEDFGYNGYSFDNWGSIAADNPSVCVELAFGHRRLAAYKFLAETRRAGDWNTIPVDLRPMTDLQMANMAWSENEKRRDHTPLERARALQKALDDFSLSHQELAESRGLSRSSVSNILRLLKLPASLQEFLHSGEISERQAMALIPLYDQSPALSNLEAFQFSTATIVGMARGGASADILRQRVQEAIAYAESQIQPALVKPEAAPLPAAPLPAAPDEPPARTFQYVPGVIPSRDNLSHTAPPPEPEYTDPPEMEQPEPDFSDDEPPAPEYVDPPTPPSQARPAAPPSAQAVRPAPAPAAPPAVQPAHPTPAPEPPPAPASLTWEESTVVVTITWFPGQDGQRMIMLATRVNNDPPTMRPVSEYDLANGAALGAYAAASRNYIGLSS